MREMSVKYRKERHSVTDLKVHLVCVTKYRLGVFSEPELTVICYCTNAP